MYFNCFFLILMQNSTCTRVINFILLDKFNNAKNNKNYNFPEQVLFCACHNLVITSRFQRI